MSGQSSTQADETFFQESVVKINGSNCASPRSMSSRILHKLNIGMIKDEGKMWKTEE